MKESSNLYSPQKKREKRKLSKRLGGPSMVCSDGVITQGATAIRQNFSGGQFAENKANSQKDTLMKSQAKGSMILC